MAEQEVRRLQIELAARESDSAPAAVKVRDLMTKEIEYYGKEKKRYEKDKDEIKKIADAFTEESFTNQRRDGYFDTAEMLLQIAIVMASVAMLANSRLAYGTAVTLAIVGAFLTFDGYTLAFKIGALEPEAAHEEKKPEEPKGSKHALAIRIETPPAV
jgi:hypothetical protein